MKMILTAGLLLAGVTVAQGAFAEDLSPLCKDQKSVGQLQNIVKNFGYPCSAVASCTAHNKVVLTCKESHEEAMFIFQPRMGQMTMLVSPRFTGNKECYSANTGQQKPVSFCTGY